MRRELEPQLPALTHFYNGLSPREFDLMPLRRLLMYVRMRQDALSS